MHSYGRNCRASLGRLDVPPAVQRELQRQVQTDRLRDRLKLNRGAERFPVFQHDIKGSDRVAILLTAISYQGRIIIEKDLVKKIV